MTRTADSRNGAVAVERGGCQFRLEAWRFFFPCCAAAARSWLLLCVPVRRLNQGDLC